MEKIEMPLLGMCYPVNLDSIVDVLIRCKSDTFNYYYDFCGVKLYSDTVTLEDAYQEVYGMTREEYRIKLDKAYQKYLVEMEKLNKEMHEEYKASKDKIFKRALEVVGEDNMDIFNNVFNKLSSPFSNLNEEIMNDFFNLIEYLNGDDYELETAKTMFRKIQPRGITDYNYVLKAIKVFAIHGDILFDELYDEEREKSFMEGIALLNKRHKIEPIIIPSTREYTYEDELDSYDRRRTSMLLAGYYLCKIDDKEEKKTL